MVGDVSDVSLIGVVGEVQITCAPGLGLAFLNVTRLSFQGLNITGCGLSSSNTSALMSAVDTSIDLFMPQTVAVVIASCTDVVMDHVTFVSAAGLGLVGVNIAGQSNFTNNVFSRDTGAAVPACSYLSGVSVVGGAAFLFLDYVNHTSNISVEMNVENSTFAYNHYCGSDEFQVQLASRYRLSSASEIGLSLIGTGAGLSLGLAQKGFSVNINVRGCIFEKNVATYGGVASVYWYTGLQDSHVQFTDCTFSDNKFEGRGLGTVEQGGIGLVKDISVFPVRYGQTNPSCVLNHPNSLTISRTNFFSNFVSGVCVQSFYATPSSILDQVTVDSCRFENNMATALFAFEAKKHGLEEGTSVLVQNCAFVNNTVQDVRSAVVFASAMNITIKDSSFHSNIGTAVGTTNSLVILEGAVEFISNSALQGGALYLTSLPFLLVRNSSSISFINNTAILYGGAVYVDYTLGVTDLQFSRYTCFLFFESIDILCNAYVQCSNITDININMAFSNNTAYSGGTFYGVYLDNCPWAYQLTNGQNRSVLDVMYERSAIFHFDQRPTTSAVISTPTNTLVIANTSVLSYMPGQQFTLQLNALDIYKQSVQAVVTANTSDAQLGDSGFFLTANPSSNVKARVYGLQDVTMNVTLYSLDTYASIPISVELMECLLFVYNETAKDCQCSDASARSNVTCDPDLKVFNITSGWWFGRGPNRVGVVYWYCPAGYCNEHVQVVYPQALDDQCVNHHTGLLCGGCQEGYSAVFGTNRCMKCTNNPLGLLVFFAAAGIGIIAIISFLRITITNGYVYGVLLYANLGSLYAQYFTSLFGSLLIPLIPLQILNLGLGFETCFYNGMTPLVRAGLGLIFPAYLFILMVLFIWLASRSLRLSEWLANSNFTPSKLVGTLIVLTYNSITQSCFQILDFFELTVYEENGSSTVLVWTTDPNVEYLSPIHAVLFAISIVLLVVYIIPVPILLVLPSFNSHFLPSSNFRFIWKMKPLYDTFFSPFKEDRTFWIGFSLVLRIVLTAILSFAIYYLAEAFTLLALVVAVFLYALFEPYKTASQNAIYVFFMGNILTLGIFSLCLKQYQLSPRQADYGNIVTTFIALASAVLGTGYLMVLLVLLWTLYPTLYGMYSFIRSLPKTHQSDDNVRNSSSTRPLTTTEPVDAEQTKQKRAVVTFSELREPMMEETDEPEGYLNVQLKT